MATCLFDPRGPKLVLGWPLSIYTPHDLRGLLTAKGRLWLLWLLLFLSNNRLLKYQAQLLECPDVNLQVFSA
jgi:hypothetical protein